MQKVLDVHMGEVKIAKKGELLKAILGSCVGIGIIWSENESCGLAHCLLPENPNPTFSIGGRFVDQAIDSLLALMKIRKGDYSKISVVIVGGGNMMGPKIVSGSKDSSQLVGSTNFRVATQIAKKLGLKVVHSDGGGEEGRKIIVNAADFSFRVEKIPRING